MGLETANFITGLVQANPPATDQFAQGDDHLRLIKRVLQQTFPTAGFSISFTVKGGALVEKADEAAMRAFLLVAGLADANTFTAKQTIQLSDDTAVAGPVTDFERVSLTPAASDLLALLRFLGRNDAAAQTIYGGIGAKISNVAAASEGGIVYVQAAAAGVLADRLYIGAGLWSPAATGGDKGIGTFNPAELWINGIGPFAPPSLGTAGMELKSTGATTPTFAWGAVVQEAHATLEGVITTTATFPLDDTIPQIGEGTGVLTLDFTPKSVTNTLQIDIILNYALSSATPAMILALFQDSGVDALNAVAADVAAAGALSQIRLRHYVSAASLTLRTFKVRVGASSAATVTLNGFGGARKFGGVLNSSISVRELGA